jgi:hypothetical protein
MDDDEDDEPDDMLMRILAVRAVAVEMVGEQQWDALGKSYSCGICALVNANFLYLRLL